MTLQGMFDFFSRPKDDNHPFEKAQRQVYKRSELGIPPHAISPQAIRIIETLQKKGYQAYIVGGAVRDLLCKKSPKDFDIVTSARPEKVKKLFSSARIIGRRFQIVHITLDRVVYEVSTLRRHRTKRALSGWLGGKKTATNGVILRDNNFGSSLDEDVWGRDITLNALYFDPVRDEIYDFFDGVRDLKERRVVMIGEPQKRFAEDPVRLIRLLRFCAQLSFSVPKDLKALLHESMPLLREINSARLFEELRKLIVNQHAIAIVEILHAYGALGYLVPLLEEYYDDPLTQHLTQQALLNTQRRLQEGKSVRPAFLLAVFLWVPFKEMTQKLRPSEQKKHVTKAQLSRIFSKIFERNQYQYTLIVREQIFQIWALQFRMQSLDPDSPDAAMCTRNLSFRAAYDFLVMRSQAGDVATTLIQAWQPHYIEAAEFRAKHIREQRTHSTPKRRNSRRHTSRR